MSGDLLYLESNGRERRRVGDDTGMSTVQYIPVTVHQQEIRLGNKGRSQMGKGTPLSNHHSENPRSSRSLVGCDDKGEVKIGKEEHERKRRKRKDSEAGSPALALLREPGCEGYRICAVTRKGFNNLSTCSTAPVAANSGPESAAKAGQPHGTMAQ